ncbi:hypothetical protein PMAYCL1PPCAC_14130, partial [Pristionchus mayeri]
TTAEWACFCKEDKSIYYCQALKYKNQNIPKNFTRTKCLTDAKKELMNAGTKTMGMYRIKEILSSTNSSILTNNEDMERANFFCDAIDANVSRTFKKTFLKSPLW